MKRVARILACATAVAFSLHATGQTATIDLAGNDHEGAFTSINLKNWATEAQLLDPNGLPDYPYFFNSTVGPGVWSSIIAEPLSPATIYPVEVGDPPVAVFNKAVTDPDFQTRNPGRLVYDTASLSGLGTEFIDAEDIEFEIDGDAFSPLNSVHNDGSGLGNAAWLYVVTVENPSGTGITFENGVPVSVDLVADVSIEVLFGGQAPLASLFEAEEALVLTGNRFVFDFDITQDTASPLGLLTDVRLVIDRRGSIAILEERPCPADVNRDGTVNDSDFFAWVTAFINDDPECDVNLDETCSDSDFFAWVTLFIGGCP